MTVASKFLIIDTSRDGRFFIGANIAKKFPDAILVECTTPESALQESQDPKLSAIICHTVTGMSGLELVSQLRKLRPRIPIVLVSNVDRETEAMAAGANRFLKFDEWLRIGTILEELLG